MEEAPPKKTVEFEEAISFVNNIKKPFQNDDHVYKSFLDILNMYHKEHKVITEVYREHFLVNILISSMNLLDFGLILQLLLLQLLTLLLLTCIRERQQRDMAIDPKGERDLSVERPGMEDDKTVTKLHKEQKRHTERENSYRKNRGQDDRDHNTENIGDISMHRLLTKRSLLRRLKTSVGQTWPPLMVADLLGKYPDIMEEFNEFLERCERIDGFLAGVMESLWSEGNSSKSTRIDEKENEPKRDLEGGKEKDRYNLKYWGKSIQELDLSNCERCTPSYRLLPEDVRN
ncbi:hypothetical protein CASFOL_014617 [Castilleja foliolosa]|uniref:Paired amphipathic helix protein Sin3-like 2 n=1 Tax=Castilleja foliolosa TaxID=1961234 RepID=A0ABD3DER3_9LAMI